MPSAGRPALWVALLACLALPASAAAAGSAYVTNGQSADVSQYAIGAGGMLSSLTPATVATGGSPSGVAVSPDGKSAYVANSNGSTVSQFTIDPVSGALTPKTPATVATGLSPSGVAVSPDGKSAYVANAGGST
ncbi:MAG: lactonase family protein, partial [Actinomycetota bacterium]|nr:lactonase family protein [Actinomycetota bacterium]